jgi:hypothetical protein
MEATMGFFSKIGTKLVGVLDFVFAAESKRVYHMTASAGSTGSTASLGGRSCYTNASGVNWGAIAFARSKSRRSKGVNRHRSDRTG